MADPSRSTPSAAADAGGSAVKPYIPASKNLPELTVRAIILGAVLSVVLAAANAYLGLFAGMTVSASIPAAVLSMGILKLLGGGNILENNLVQTAASAGESLVAGVIFTIPALVIAGYWGGFNYWETSLIACFGGLMGVMFTIPLRRSLIIDQPLQFPEGVATAEVLKVGQEGGKGIKSMLVAGAIGALFKLGAGGFKLWAGTAQVARSVGGTVAYVGSNLSPALVAVGYIVGLNIAILIFIGGAINWWIAIPAYIGYHGIPVDGSAADVAFGIWSTKTRYLGVGAMAVGGLWALIKMRKSLFQGITSGMEAYRKMREHGAEAILRTERDTPMQWVAVGVVVAIVPLFFLFYHFTGRIGLSAFMSVIMVVAGFMFSAVAAYMAGLVGSSNNPISGVTIATVLTAALLLLAVLGEGNTVGPIAAILIGGAVCCAAAIGGDNMQDLKAGQLVGATPWKQQVMQVIGVVCAAFAIAPILNLLHTAYGIGVKVHPDKTPLQAPQASLTEAVSKLAGGFESSALPWTMIFIGMGIAVVVIAADVVLERRNATFRMPVLAMAVGIYLPFELSLPILLGGLIALAANRVKGSDEHKKRDGQTGLLFAAGLITGEALVGIGIALPIAISGDPNVLTVGNLLGIFGPDRPWAGLVLLGLLSYFLYRAATSLRRNPE